MRRVSVAEVFGRATFVKISDIPVDSIRELKSSEEIAHRGTALARTT